MTLSTYENLLNPMGTTSSFNIQSDLNSQRYVKLNYIIPTQCGQKGSAPGADGSCEYADTDALPGLVTDDFVKKNRHKGAYNNYYFKITTFHRPDIPHGIKEYNDSGGSNRNVPWPFDVNIHWDFDNKKLRYPPLDAKGATPKPTLTTPDKTFGWYNKTEWSIHSTIVDQIRRGAPQAQLVFDNQGNILICPLGCKVDDRCHSVGPQGGLDTADNPTPSSQLNPAEFYAKSKPGAAYCFAAPIYINPTAGNNSGAGPPTNSGGTTTYINTEYYYSVTTLDIFNPALRPNDPAQNNPNATNPNGKWIASLENKYWLYNDAPPTKDTSPYPSSQYNLNLYNGSYHILYNPIHRSNFRDYYANEAVNKAPMSFGHNSVTNPLLLNYCYSSVNPGTQDQWSTEAYSSTIYAGPFSKPLFPSSNLPYNNPQGTGYKDYAGGTSPTIEINPLSKTGGPSNEKGNNYYADHLCNYFSPPNPTCTGWPNTCSADSASPQDENSFMNPLLASYFSGDNSATWNVSQVLDPNIIKGILGGDKLGGTNPMACFETPFSKPPSVANPLFTIANGITDYDSFISGNKNIGNPQQMGTNGVYDNGFSGVLTGSNTDSDVCNTNSITINICDVIISQGGAGQISNNKIVEKCGNSGRKIPCNQLKPALQKLTKSCSGPPSSKPQPSGVGENCGKGTKIGLNCPKGTYCDTSSGLSVCRQTCTEKGGAVSCPTGQSCISGKCKPNNPPGSTNVWCSTTGSQLGGTDPFTYTGNASQEENTTTHQAICAADGSMGNCTRVDNKLSKIELTSWAEENCNDIKETGKGWKVGWWSCNCGTPDHKEGPPECIFQPNFSGEQPDFPPQATSDDEILGTKYPNKQLCDSSNTCSYNTNPGGMCKLKPDPSPSHHKKKFPIIPVIAGSAGILIILVLIFIFFV